MPPTLGHRLRHAREARQLSPEDVAFKIKIPPARVRDLEEDSYTAFGSMTYARSFLKTYASYLGVDASDVLLHLKSPPLGGACDYKYLVTDLGPWVSPAGNDHQTMVPPRKTVPNARPLALVAMGCFFVLLASVGILVANGSFFKTRPEPAEPAREPVAATQPRLQADPLVAKPSSNAKPSFQAPPTQTEATPKSDSPPPRAQIVE
jgi:cytoskeletal protein RodZ